MADQYEGMDFDAMSDEELGAFLAQQAQPGEAAPPAEGEAPEAEGPEDGAADAAEDAAEGEDQAEDQAEDGQAPATPPPPASASAKPQPLPPHIVEALRRDEDARAAQHRAQLVDLYGSEEVADAILEAEARGRHEVAQAAQDDRFQMSLAFAKETIPGFEARMQEVGKTLDRAVFGAMVETAKGQPNPALFLWEQSKAILTPSDRAAMVEAAKKEAMAEAKRRVAEVAKRVSGGKPSAPSLGTIGAGGPQGVGVESISSWADADSLPDEELDLLVKQAKAR